MQTNLYISQPARWPSLPPLACGGTPALLPVPELALQTGGSVLQQYLQVDSTSELEVSGVGLTGSTEKTYLIQPRRQGFQE